MLNDDDIKNVYEKIDDLNSVAYEMRVNDSTQAMTLSQEAVELATEIHYEKGLARGLATLGFSYIRISQHEEALNYLDKSYKLFISLNDKEGQSDILEYYGIIQRSLGNLEASLGYLFKALALAEETNYKKTESQCLYHIGVSYRYLGKFEEALNYFLKSLDKARLINYAMPQGYCLNNIGLIYLETGDYTNALEYYNQSLAIRRKLGDKWGESGNLDNIGFIYFKLGNYTEAIKNCSQSLVIAEGIDDQKGHGNALLHLGNIYEKLTDYEQAMNCYNSSLQIRRKIGDKKGEAEILLSLAELSIIDNFKIQSNQQALELLYNALELGEQTKALDLLAKIKYVLYEAYKKLGNYNEALSNLESSLLIEKEIHNASIKEKVLNLEISNRVEQSQKEAEIHRLRNVELVALNEEITKQKMEIEKQKAKSDELLLNILPSEVAEELKDKGYTTAKAFDEVTILFSDIKGFTNVAEKMTAQELVKEINTYFSAFDSIIQKYGLEKIKTIGDAYIAAGGLPEKNFATPQNVIDAAIVMQQEVEKLKQERVTSNKPYFELRIGIHTGPVVAGVVGLKKFQYDIWGDTVNLAARMEQSGVPGKINISQHTYELVKEQFTCVHRGRIDAKNKGEIDMYFVE
jgi:class 3 adenylate cyclase/Tfp pilus assembly protein PilF